MTADKPNRSYKAQTTYLTPLAHGQLNNLSKRLRIPKAVLLREAVDMLLAKYGTAEGA